MADMGKENEQRVLGVGGKFVLGVLTGSFLGVSSKCPGGGF